MSLPPPAHTVVDVLLELLFVVLSSDNKSTGGYHGIIFVGDVGGELSSELVLSESCPHLGG